MQDTGITGYAALGDDVNKLKKSDQQETAIGVVSDKLPELTLDMSDEEIVKMTDKWEKIWKDSPKQAEWVKMCDENEKYWLGKHFDTPMLDKNRPNVDNVIFESLETYLPQATRRNPEPMVSLDAREYDSQGNADDVKLAFVNKVKLRLADLADKNFLRLKLKKGARHWAIYLLGVAKFGWSLDKDIPTVQIVRGKKIILDPDATIEEDGYTGNRVGEFRKLTAQTILDTIGDSPEGSGAKKVIIDLVKDSDNMGTEIEFIEWWTPQYMCWKLGKNILWKKKNPHWNYDKTQDGQTSVDDYGNETPAAPVEMPGLNHFASPKMPYEFLTVFNLGDQPMDKTSLIGQNLSNQDRINKRNKQIDKNADKMNGGAVVSLGRSGLTEPQAKKVVEAVRKGGAVLIPDGNPQEAVYFPQVPSMPADVFNNLYDMRTRLRDIFGVTGSTASGIQGEETVRGKVITRGLDTDRIGGGVTEYLEQWASNIYNWFFQMLYVYDDGFQILAGGVPPKILINVKEGSLLPKDSTSIANQALELAKLNRISNIDLYKRLEFPNPEEMAANVWLEVNAPQLLFKDNPMVQEAMGMQQQAMQAQQQQQTDMQAQDAAAQAQQSQMSHEQNLQTEVLKGAMNMGARSVLPAVPPSG